MKKADNNITIEEGVKTKRAYRRRTEEEIEADRIMLEEQKAAKKAAREAAKAAKEAAKKEKEEEKEKSSSATPGRRKSNGQKVIIPNGDWNSPDKSMVMNSIKIELKLIESSLGMSPSDKNLLTNYIASKAPDAMSKAEEIAVYGEEKVEKKATTIYPRGYFEVASDGSHLIDSLWRKGGGRGHVDPEVDERHPFFWNYQLRGFFKDSCGLLTKASYGLSAETTAYKKVIDGGIFVEPRRVAITLPEVWYDDEGNDITPEDIDNLPVIQRRIRKSGPTGEQICLASSEIIPAGSTMKFMIRFTDPKNRDLIYEWLNYGTEHGLGSWRNAGFGIFQWRLLNDDWTPMT